MQPNQTSPILPNSHEIEMARQAERELSPIVADNKDVVLRVDSPETDSIEIPLSNTAAAYLLKVLSNMSRGNAVTIYPLEAELTTMEAADFLNVSRPYLVGLLEKGKLDYHKVGTHRRIKLVDLAEYKRKRDSGREATLSQLAKESQELELYE